MSGQRPFGDSEESLAKELLMLSEEESKNIVLGTKYKSFSFYIINFDEI